MLMFVIQVSIGWGGDSAVKLVIGVRIWVEIPEDTERPRW